MQIPIFTGSKPLTLESRPTQVRFWGLELNKEKLLQVKEKSQSTDEKKNASNKSTQSLLNKFVC